MRLQKDYKEFIELLEENQVDYLLVGAYALAAHGYIRYTHDIDFLIANTLENARKMINVLSQFGFSSLGLTEDDFLSDDLNVQLGNPPVRIDIITSITGIENFDQVKKNRVFIDVEGLKIPTISRKDLIHNKRSTGRTKDQADAEELEK
jgi:hypothetical protein